MHRCCLYVYESDITGLRGGRRRKGEERGRVRRERGGGKEEEKIGGKGRKGGRKGREEGRYGRKREGYERERGKERSVEKARGSYMLGEERQSAV